MNESIKKDTNIRSLGANLYTDTDKEKEILTKTTSYATPKVTYQDIPSSTITFYLEKTTTVLFLYSGQVYIAIPASGYIARSTLNIDSVDQGSAIYSKDTGKSETETLVFIKELTAGSHAVKGRLASDDDTEVVEAIINSARITIIF